jgi:hypothetical protein
LEERSFAPIHNMAPEREWLTCRVQDGKWRGDGGVPMLVVIIRTFLEWARQEPAIHSEGAG